MAKISYVEKENAPDMVCRNISRRQFIRVVGVGGATVVVIGVLGCGEDESQSLQPQIGCFDVGSPNDYMEGDLLYFPDAPLLVGLDTAGFYAMSAICTHLGCGIGDDVNEVTAEGPILCSCTASIFSRTGDILSGPAPLSLQHYRLELVDGQLVCDTSVEVPSDTRLAVV
ncbi:Rieske (2Fe-2S) protein [Desulfobacterota bacterium AH_259_B03_O07]|nr:Rieske (2Fe-2S) protein [Desulfobacterota bacterium AH_259_B03_O07]